MSTPLLALNNLTVRFGKAFQAGPLDLHADCGIVHLVGPNGSGKTSLLRAMCGELTPAAGSVLVQGLDVHRRAEARRAIALAPATPELPEFLTVREAWEFTASLRGVRAWRGESYCDALALPASLKLGHGSAGQRRKAELICALAGDPPVLLLDETFAHLDQDAVNALAEWLHQWAGHRLILLTHHGKPPVAVTQTVPLPGA